MRLLIAALAVLSLGMASSPLSVSVTPAMAFPPVLAVVTAHVDYSASNSLLAIDVDCESGQSMHSEAQMDTDKVTYRFEFRNVPACQEEYQVVAQVARVGKATLVSRTSFRVLANNNGEEPP
jgi:hypothetical protein